MKRLEKLIREIRGKLFPYHHEHDINRDAERWNVAEGEYLESWLVEQLRICRKKNRCERGTKCVFYEYSDIAKKNFEICLEVQLRLENGEIKCLIEDDPEGEDK